MKRIITLSIVLATFMRVGAQLPQISLVQLASGMSSPVDIKSCGDERLFIVEQKGLIQVLYKDGTKQSTPFLDIDARVNNAQDEQGLLGLAFSPNYKQDGFFYVQYTTGPGVDSIRVSRFSVMAGDSSHGDPNSEKVLISFKDLEWNHNGGNLMFGPDGYLYISEGDGGSANDPNSSHGTGGNGQNTNVFFAKMLRVDVSDTAAGYTVPPTNPFVGVANTKPEIWAYGLRNPWRCSFDRLTGDMWMGDVGQNTYEEIDFQPANDAGGQNYGWRCREGLHACPSCTTTGCAASGFAEPVVEIPHANGACSITGGYVYRGTQYGKLFGLYLFTDYCNGQIWTLKKVGNTWDLDTLGNFSNYQYTSFGQDNLGELYLAYRGSSTGSTGLILKITETTNCNPVAFVTFDDTITTCAQPVTLNALQGDTLSYQWYDSNGSINGASSSQFTASQSGWYKVLVSKTLQAGCEAFSDSVYVNIADTTAIVPCNCLVPLCVNGAALPLGNVVSPSGGVFSGMGVQSDTLFPNMANVGANTVAYQYTNTSGCVSNASFDVMVNFYNNVTKNFPVTTYCTTDAPFYLGDYFMPPGGVISGTAVANDTFNPSLAVTPADAWVYYAFTNKGGCVTTDSFQLAVTVCNGINNISNDFAITISPNPAKRSFTIHTNLAANQDAEIVLTDLNGRVCFSKKQTFDTAKPSLFVELPQMAAGTYTVRVKTDKGIGTKKLVIE